MFCNSRENVSRYLDIETGKKAWVCSTCGINLDPAKVVPVKIAEDNEVKCDLFRKEEVAELTPAQEDLVCEHRER